MTTLATEISPLALYEALNRGDSLALLDVRNEEEFKMGRVEGRHAAPGVNIPYFGFVDDEEAAVARIPFGKDERIVVVCAKGGSSDYVAQLLRERGYQAVNMVGGMLVWGDFYAVRDVVPPTSEFQLVQFNRPGKASLSYLVGSEGEALVVDANRVIEPYLDEARKRGLTIRHVLDTHVHADYISGGSQLARETGATYHISGICGYQGDLKTDGQPGEIRVGSIVAQKIHTPGHTPGSTSLLVDGKYLLTGDTLFVESVGRPDLGGQAEPWAKQLYGTLFGTLKDLPDGTQILPSHYANASELRDDDLVVGDLGSIRRENEGMQAKSEEEFIEFIRANMRPSPEHYGKIRQINMAVLSVCDGTLMELDLGKNECAASKGKG